MGILVSFRRTMGQPGYRNAQEIADLVGYVTAATSWPSYGCANGMPGYPPCRSPAELEAMLRARADTTAARESV